VATRTASAGLLERDVELAALEDALAAAREGRGGIVVVDAPAGLGKTTLLKAAARSAADAGFNCLNARASELERDFAYGCVRQLLEPTVAGAGDERDRLFGGAAALARPLFEPIEAARPASPLDNAFGVLHGLYWLVNNIAADSPVALVVDDLHWADVESLRFLSYMAPRLDGLPVAVLASARPGEGDTEELARLAAVPEATVLRPAPLSDAATLALCAERLGGEVAPEFAHACREATGGNPFFLEALLREAREQKFATDKRAAANVRRIGPASVARAVRLRLAGRGQAAGALVDAVAVIGDGARVGEAAGVAGVDETEAARIADLLVALAILKPADRLEFAHPIIREAIYGGIGPAERGRAHARAARILTERQASDERIAAQVAAAEPAGDPDRVDLLLRVASHALCRGAPTAAVAWLRRALAEPPLPDSRADVVFELGCAEQRLGDPGAAAHLIEAVDLISDPEWLTRAARRLALALTMSGDPNAALAALESALADVEQTDRESALILESEIHAHAQQADLGAREPAARRVQRHSDLRGDTPGERLVLAAQAFEQALKCESAGESVSHLEPALAGGLLLAEQELDAPGPFFHLILGLLAAEALDVADAALDQGLALARERGSIPGLAYVAFYRARVGLRRGDLARAETEARTAVELLEAHRIPFGLVSARALVVEALIGQGDLAEAERTLDPEATEAQTLLYLAQGRAREGYESAARFGPLFERWGLANPLSFRWRSHAAPALFALGDHEAARRLAAEDLDRARRWGAPGGLGLALRTVALLAEGGPSPDGLGGAVEVLEGAPNRLEQARALTDLGAALRSDNRRADARKVLERAAGVASRCGARGLADRARDEIQAAGGRWSDPFGEGVAQLTASERRVAELAAAGQSNPEIAQTLFVTRKTVETHLGRVYRKLDIAGRGELAGALPD
jgi:DNA-binding CsgD family transcriptional regulator